MKTLTTLIAVVLISLTSSVQAGNVNKREAAQRNSIRNGYQDGSLTGQEARYLRNQQIRLERKEQRFRADGEVSPGERVKMHNSLDANRASIYRQRHDDQQQED